VPKVLLEAGPLSTLCLRADYRWNRIPSPEGRLPSTFF
jgi:hypothetical protein